MAALVLCLFLQGLARQEIGRSSTRSGGRPVPSLQSVGPVFDASADPIRSVGPGPNQIALTFDDGPDPKWTPQVLEVLRRHGVRATFFVVGSYAAANPGLVRAELRDGHEIGSHTFTHANPADISTLRSNLELTLTETALAGAGGINTALFRLPYSSSPGDLDSAQFAAARRASRQGYLVVAATLDGEDWRRPGIDRIMAAATPPPGHGAVILLHDGGGDRAETVAAVDRLVTSLQARGYGFVTISQMAGLPAGSADSRVSTLGHVQGLVLLAVLRLAFGVTALLSALWIPVGVLALLRALAVVALARRHSRVAVDCDDSFLPPVSVVVPAFNEEVGIAASVRSLAASDYPDVEVLVVDDGSTDRTAAVVAALDDPNVRLLRQDNAGKPAALNAGIAAASHDVIVMVDGDTVFEPDTVRELVRPLADPSVGAVSGNTKVGNRRGVLGRWQHVEYVIGFNLDRRMYDTLRCMPTVPGAAGAFRRLSLDAVGGVSEDTLAEDTDLTMAIHRAGWRVVYQPQARAWTEAPASLGALWRQRYRWCYGTLQSMWKHRGAVREGSELGRRGLPYLLLFQVMLPLLAPAIDLFALYGLLFLSPLPVLAYWLGFNAVQLGLGAYAFHLDEERFGPLWTMPLQQLVYRQLMYLVVIQSVMSAAVGARLRWQKLDRTGGVEIAGSHE